MRMCFPLTNRPHGLMLEVYQNYFFPKNRVTYVSQPVETQSQEEPITNTRCQVLIHSIIDVQSLDALDPRGLCT